MGLIDADALLKKFERMWDCTDIVFEPKELLCDPLSDCKGCKWKEILDFVKRIVKSSKTVDAVPVVHAHWVERFTGNEYVVECSNCKNESNEMADYHVEYDYCPHCGAKMHEKEGCSDG